MPFSIQTKYHENTFSKGDVVAIRPEGFKYFEGDCLKEWLAAGRSAESYRFAFVINYIVDEDMNGAEPEVLELLELYSEDVYAEFQRKRYLTLPDDYLNINRVELRETGETKITWSELKQYIRVRI